MVYDLQEFLSITMWVKLGEIKLIKQRVCDLAFAKHRHYAFNYCLDRFESIGLQHFSLQFDHQDAEFSLSFKLDTRSAKQCSCMDLYLVFILGVSWCVGSFLVNLVTRCCFMIVSYTICFVIGL